MGIIAPRRDPAYPTVPTIKELTGKDLPEPPSWLAFFINKNVPSTVKKQIESDMRNAALDPRVKELLAKQDYTPYGNMTLTDFNLQINRQVKEFHQMSQKFNIVVK
jgi:tripartite-type tricarboxylate transporter receptor subunit TctC